MKKLTERQSEVLGFIKSYITNKQYPPTIREISSNFEISVKGAYDHIKALEKKNFIRCNENRSRAIEVLGEQLLDEKTIEIPIIGNVAAGVPLMAEENWEGSLSLPTALFGKGTHFGLHVKGDSMIDAGILDGDLALIKQQETAENGEIVVAMVEEAVTLKRFYKEKNRIRLKAENSNYKPIFTQDVRILGKLVNIIRSYG
ncbi:transcriptional repressor LexA [Spirochaeta cellobiosiphila]|uniref:transcriptional repressor LexA n=1 Tax=Spirochaeta cellobiosiphila TaxID=504483 RepID=UPI00042449F6|nr:transcriptional repressor LexA [Spirochaeta cellobiosiphila]